MAGLVKLFLLSLFNGLLWWMIGEFAPEEFQTVLWAYALVWSLYTGWHFGGRWLGAGMR